MMRDVLERPRPQPERVAAQVNRASQDPGGSCASDAVVSRALQRRGWSPIKGRCTAP